MPRSPRHRSTPLLLAFLVTAFVLTLGPGSARALPGDASPDGVWREALPVAQLAIGTATVTTVPTLRSHRLFDIDTGALEAILRVVPRDALSASPSAGVRLTLPMRDGTYQPFEFEERPVFSPELAAAHPGIRAFLGQGVDDRTLTAYFVQTPAGFYAFIRTPGGILYMEPNGLGNTRQSIAYTRADFSAMPAFDCQVPGDEGSSTLDGSPLPLSPFLTGTDAPSGATLSTYRLAVSATGEFTSLFDPGGGTGNTVSQIAASVAAVNLIYLPEVTIQFTVVCNNVFEDASSDPFTDADNSSPSLGHNQTSTDANCGAYDIGHVFHSRPSGFSGLASGSVVCVDGSKARGYSSVPSPIPTNSIWIVDQLCHEMGHQFSAAHSFNSDVTGCSGNRSAGSAYEPGSGSTIMSYAAGTRCDFDFPGTNDGYFHGHSFDQITSYRDNGGNCATTSATNNAVPTVDAGDDFTIPQGTPFRLTATGADADDGPDALTYCWEQFDLGDPGDFATNVNGPLFRSRPPTTDPMRVFPAMSDILAGNPTPTEILPLVDRTLNFRCTVRDNRATGGGVNNDAMVVTVEGDPFFVTSPDGGETLTADCLTTITWTVGGGDVADNVNILLSTDGGATFPTTLAANVANDGSHEVRLPCVTTTQGRVMVEAVDNIFFDVSDDDFTIVNDTPEVAIEATGGSVGATCEFLVPYSAVVTDDCRVDAATIDVSASSLDGDATVGEPTVNVNVVGPGEVEVSGTVLVSALTGCPAVVRITVSGEDECGVEGSQFADVEVVDDTPPEISVTLNATHLWPPNHQLVTITAEVTVSDNCSGTTYELTSVTSDEPEDGLGDGDTAPDVVAADSGTPDVEFQLRAERAGNGDGRVYTVIYTASDPCGNSTPDTATVRVNHSKLANALPAAGFEASGLAFDPAAPAIALIVPGALPAGEREEELLDGFSGPNAVLTDVPAGARSAPAARVVTSALIGNTGGMATAHDIVRLDADGDGVDDNLLIFESSAVRALLEASAMPVGLHFATSPDASFEVPDLLSLGTVAPLPDAVRAFVSESITSALATLEGPGVRTGEVATAGGIAMPVPTADGLSAAGSIAVTQFRGVQPNPFRGTAAFAYQLASPGRVRLTVYSAAGRAVRVIEDSIQPSGRHVRQWDGLDSQGRPLPPGIYIVHFAAPGVDASAKAVLLR